MATKLQQAAAFTCRPHWRTTRINPALSAVCELFSHLGSPVILGGNKARFPSSRFSYWASNPVRTFEFSDGQNSPFRKLQQNLRRYRLPPRCKSDLPSGIFCGGWAGYFSYDLASYIENVSSSATDDINIPLIHLRFYDRLIAYDHRDCHYILIALSIPGDNQSPQQKLDEMQVLLSHAESIQAASASYREFSEKDLCHIQCNVTADHYLRSVKKLIHYIYEGDVYQVNFSQRFNCPFHARPIDLFHWQNLYNPSPYAAYIDAGSFKIVSASPELFLNINNGLIRTKPIKGTRPRYRDEDNSVKLNRTNYFQLLHNEKEKAELNMITDLERNDLTRVSVPGTIHVTESRHIESFPTVFHALSTVQAKLRPQTSLSRIIKATFPGGSITGAPKINAMKFIDLYEPTKRTIYTGSMGFVGIDGSADLNIAIRTVIIKNKTAFIQAGGGIVADSDPEAEYNETITKAKALLAGIIAVNERAEIGHKA